MNINQTNNSEDVFIRVIIAAVGKFLNKRFSFNQIVKGKTETHEVPFFYTVSLDERFLQDFFIPILDFCNPKVEGNVDRIPRGSFQISSVSLNQNSISNNSVRSNYEKKKEGSDNQIRTYSSNVTFMPVTFNFECKVLTNTYLESFKLWESITSFYKTKTITAQYKNYPSIPIRIQFSEDIQQNTNFEFSYGDEQKLEIPFSLEVYTILPIIDYQKERLRENSIEGGVNFNIALK